MSPHDATARAKADPVQFLMDVFDHLDDAHGICYEHKLYRLSPQAIVYRTMDGVVRGELAAGGIEVVR